MADFWQIQGEAGKALDATVRDVSALGYAGLRCFFNSLGVDEFTFSKELEGLAPAVGELLPENNQTVTLWRDGVKYFHGKALVIQRGRRVDVTVFGPGWEAEAIPYVVANVDQAGTSKQRPYAKLAAATLSSQLGTVVDQCTALGVPWQKGTIPTTWNCDQITIQQQNCLPAVTEICRFVADMMQWVDYATTPPTVHFSRRLTGLAVGTATVRTLDAEAIDGDDSGSMELIPKLQQKVEQVRIPYVTRSATGARLYQEQASGVPAVARVQWLPWNGPELDSFLPDEGSESYVLQTTPANGTMSTLKPYLMAMLPAVMSSRAEFSGLPAAGDVTLTNGEVLEYHTNSAWDVGSNIDFLRYFNTPTLQYLNATTLAPVSKTGRHLIISQNPPDWLEGFAGMQKVKVRGMLLYPLLTQLAKSPTYVEKQPAPDPPAWFNSFAWTASRDDIGWQTVGGFGLQWNRGDFDLWWLNFEIDGWLSSTAYTTGTTFRKPADFDWSTMPAGFADGLLAAQNWLPYEGMISFTEAEAGATRYRGCVVNVTNALPELATMRAMVQSEEVNLDTGVTVLRLGAPERLSFSQVTDKFRRNSTDNLTVR